MSLSILPTSVRTRGRVQQAAFTLVELMVAMGVAAIVLGSVAAFSITGMRTVEHIATQATMTQNIGETHGLLSENIRSAVSMAVTQGGNRLILRFDENPAVDSNGDGIPYNDTNRTARFNFLDGDGSDSTITNNSFVFIRDTSQSNEVKVLLSSGVRKLPGLPIFATVGTNGMLRINLGVVDNAGGKQNQTIELKTTMILRN